MKRLVLVIFQLILINTVLANPVDERTAKKFAERFLASKTGVNLTLSSVQIPDSLSSAMYVFVAESGGFVIVSADDYAVPLLAYSTESEFLLPIPEVVAEWLTNYANEIGHLRTLNKKNEVNRRYSFENYLTQQTTSHDSAENVPPLIQTSWGQSPYYNNMCPSNSSGRAITGCVATATAQIMRYWGHPQTGCGSHSYTHPQYGTLSANFGGTTYDWSNMPMSLTSSSTPAEISAVSTLMYHVGVAVEMNYGTTGSSAYNFKAAAALRDFFRYDPNLHFEYKSNYPDGIWVDRLKYELISGHPILYQGAQGTSGHAFVCDGFSSNGFFHFNWGWRGSYDNGYYHIGNLNPGYYAFNSNNAAVFGIIPMVCSSGIVNITMQTNNTAMGEATASGLVQGTFSIGDTIELQATSYSGARFVKWSDGVTDNPRQYIVSGNHNSFMAIFESTIGDTVYYYNGVQKGTSYFLTGQRWGIRIMQTELAGRDTLKAVRVHNGSYLSSNGTLRIYSGERPADSTLIHMQTHTATSRSWNTIILDSALSISPEKNLWILFDFNAVTKSSYCGNANGSVFEQNGVWKYNKSYTWLVEAIFSHMDYWNVDGNTNPNEAGYVVGIGRKPVSLCQNIQLVAYATDGYRFLRWSDGNGQNPRIINVTSDTTLTAIYEPIHGDTVHYDGGSYIYGQSGSWIATAFSPQTIGNNNRLNSIQLFSTASNRGNHIRVYQGNAAAPETLLLDSTILSHTNNEWENINLLNPLIIDSTRWLWLAWDGSNLEVPMTTFSGINNSRLFLDNDGLWKTVEQYGTLMMRGVLGYNSTPTYTLQVNTTNSAYGSVSGSGAYLGGNSVSIQAYPSQCYHFVSWSDGNINNPRQIVISSDSTITAVFAKTIYFGTENAEACDSFTWHDTTYTSVPTTPPTYLYYTTLGCDSLISLNLTLGQTIHIEDTIVACDSVIWYDSNYCYSNYHATHYIHSTMGCDTISHLRLTINRSKKSHYFEQACDSLQWNGTTFYTDTTAEYIAMAANGCDSIESITIRISNNLHSTDTVRACSSYFWHGIRYVESPNNPLVYRQNIGNCVQSDTLYLTILQPSSSTDTITVCDSLIWHERKYTYSTSLPTFYVPGGNVQGCDSIVHLNLTVKHSSSPHYSSLHICDSVILFGNMFYEDSTINHVWVGANSVGCDSVEKVFLYVSHTTHNASFMVTCDDYYWHGQQYTQTPNEPLVYSYSDWNGCVSTDTLYLTINHTTTATDTITACDSANWHGRTYTISTNWPTYEISSGNQYGCDSIVRLNLTINHSSYPSFETQRVCDSVSLFGQTFTQDTTILHIIPNSNSFGCDSSERIYLYVTHTTHTATFVDTCNRFYWHYQTYTETPDTLPIYTYTDYNGCTSTDTLYLTIHHDVSTTDTITLSTDDFPFDYNGETITAAGNYTIVITTAAGCDSTILLHVSVVQNGISSLDEPKQVDVFPNPTNGVVSVNDNVVVLAIEVYDIYGRLMIKDTMTSSIDFGELPDGIYTLRIITPQGQTLIKVVKN